MLILIFQKTITALKKRNIYKFKLKLISFSNRSTIYIILLLTCMACIKISKLRSLNYKSKQNIYLKKFLLTEQNGFKN